ncbi:tryptophan synthase subunit alpha [Candidatus Woesearchaeota archaeon]|nr:tryptophan synthase subunit alpha [Candidatus Woesearchaeota archaeon]
MQKTDNIGIKSGKAFIPFTVLGYPDEETTIEIIRTMAENGSDMLELGFPFSDPIADGPILQEANTKAVKKGVTTDTCFGILNEIRSFTKLPIGLLLYYNLVYQYGIRIFYKTCSDLRVNTILIADVPLEESDDIIKAAESYGIKTVFIVSELTDDERLKQIKTKTTGFIYIVSKIGVTGKKMGIPDVTREVLQKLKKCTDLPLFVGFGISNPEDVRKVCETGADGALCGSAIIELINENINNKQLMISNLGDFIKEMKRATENEK